LFTQPECTASPTFRHDVRNDILNSCSGSLRTTLRKPGYYYRLGPHYGPIILRGVVATEAVTEKPDDRRSGRSLIHSEVAGGIQTNGCWHQKVCKQKERSGCHFLKVDDMTAGLSPLSIGVDGHDSHFGLTSKRNLAKRIRRAKEVVRLVAKERKRRNSEQPERICEFGLRSL